MKIMLDKSPRHIAEYSEKYDYEFWQLRTPLTRNALSGRPYGLDNGCLSGQLPKAWDRLIEDAEEHRPVFVAMPHIVGNARLTMTLFEYFERRTNGLPRALVLQDGIENIDIPWTKISAVFVGGSDDFKFSPIAFQVCRCAKMIGKWVHVGRVNIAKRAENWLGLADSIDGSGISQFDHMLEDVLKMIRADHPQHVLPLNSA